MDIRDVLKDYFLTRFDKKLKNYIEETKKIQIVVDIT